MNPFFKLGFETSNYMAPHTLATDGSYLVNSMDELTEEEKNQLALENNITHGGALLGSGLAGTGIYGLARLGVKPSALGLITGLAGAGLAALDYINRKKEIQTGVIGKKYLVDNRDEGTKYYLAKAGLL